MVPNRPGASTRVFEVIYSCLTLALNIVVTCLISFRLLFFRQKVKTALGETQNTQYIGIVAMLVESAALVVIFNAFFVATMSTQSLFRYIAFAGNVQSQVSRSSYLWSKRYLMLTLEVPRSSPHSCSSFGYCKGRHGRHNKIARTQSITSSSLPTPALLYLVERRVWSRGRRRWGQPLWRGRILGKMDWTRSPSIFCVAAENAICLLK